MSKPSPETIAIIAVGATLLVAVCSVGIGLGMLWSSGQARTDAVIAVIAEGQVRADAAIAELRGDMSELRGDVRDVRERQARTDAAIAELSRDVGELRGDMQDVRERLARVEAVLLAPREPSAEG